MLLSLICCSMLSMTMYVPVRPTPALKSRAQSNMSIIGKPVEGAVNLVSKYETVISNVHLAQELGGNVLYLQCTRTGPMSAVRAADERLMKVRTGRVYSGTPMSGH